MLIREEIVTQVGWYREEWATPYMAAVARVVFKPTIGLVPLSDPRLRLPKPEVILTPQPVDEVVPRYMPLRLDSPDVTLTPQAPLREGLDPFIASRPWRPGPDVTLTPQPVEERITALGAEGEWFKKNRILVIVVIVALVLLFFFLKKRRR